MEPITTTAALEESVQDPVPRRVRHGRHRIHPRDHVLAGALSHPDGLGRPRRSGGSASRGHRPSALLRAHGRHARGQGVPCRAAGRGNRPQARRPDPVAALRHAGRGHGLRLRRVDRLRPARGRTSKGGSTRRHASPTGAAVLCRTISSNTRWPTSPICATPTASSNPRWRSRAANRGWPTRCRF